MLEAARRYIPLIVETNESLLRLARYGITITALVVALILYVLGAAVLRQDVVVRAPERAGSVEMSFHGP